MPPLSKLLPPRRTKRRNEIPKWVPPKGANYQFRMKAHIGTDAKSKLIHTVKTTTAKVHDSEVLTNFFTEKSTPSSPTKHMPTRRRKDNGDNRKLLGVQEKATKGRTLSSAQKKKQKTLLCSFEVEHPSIPSSVCGNIKVRYKGLFKIQFKYLLFAFLLTFIEWDTHSLHKENKGELYQKGRKREKRGKREKCQEKWKNPMK